MISSLSRLRATHGQVLRLTQLWAVKQARVFYWSGVILHNPGVREVFGNCNRRSSLWSLVWFISAQEGHPCAEEEGRWQPRPWCLQGLSAPFRRWHWYHPALSRVPCSSCSVCLVASWSRGRPWAPSSPVATSRRAMQDSPLTLQCSDAAPMEFFMVSSKHFGWVTLPRACDVIPTIRECQCGWAVELGVEASFLKPLPQPSVQHWGARVTIRSTPLHH